LARGKKGIHTDFVGPTTLQTFNLAGPTCFFAWCLSFSLFNPAIFYPTENNAERSYFLSFKNNGVMLCDFFQNRALAL